MAIWREQNTARKDDAVLPTDPAPTKEPDVRPDSSLPAGFTRRTAEREMRESLIAAELTIEGKIEGRGPVRIAGRFKGDVHVEGDLTIDSGARLTGGVQARTVVIGGEVEGNITDATRVELLATGVLTGDLKAGSLTVAAGSRMRGQVEFGWEGKAQKLQLETGTGS